MLTPGRGHGRVPCWWRIKHGGRHPPLPSELAPPVLQTGGANLFFGNQAHGAIFASAASVRAACPIW